MSMIQEPYVELPILYGVGKNPEVVGYVKIDFDDCKRISKHKIRFNQNGYPYICFNAKKHLLHRVIMKAKPGDVVDHLYHDTTDCRKSSLRITDMRGNISNQCLSKHNTSGYRGIRLNPCGTWTASIKCCGKLKHLGNYLDKEIAGQAAANGRAKEGYLDGGFLPEIVPVEHLKLKCSKSTDHLYIRWYKQRNEFCVQIYHKGSKIFVGYFDLLENAIWARDCKLMELNRITIL